MADLYVISPSPSRLDPHPLLTALTAHNRRHADPRGLSLTSIGRPRFPSWCCSVVRVLVTSPCCSTLWVVQTDALFGVWCETSPSSARKRPEHWLILGSPKNSAQFCLLFTTPSTPTHASRIDQPGPASPHSFPPSRHPCTAPRMH